MSSSHPNPGASVVEWVSGLLPGVPVDWSWPHNPGRQFVVATTTVTNRNPLGFVERWGVALQSVAPDPDVAVAALATVIAAANGFRSAPAVRAYTPPKPGSVVTTFAFTRATTSGPDWQSAEPSQIGVMDRAVARLSIQVRIYPST
jgi:hypothetical protein